MDSSPSLFPGEELQRYEQEREQPSQQQKPQEHEEKELFYRTKTIQFFGRTTPIILQNDNGPCPLLAICNVLLLRNNLNLKSDCSEVSQARLLSLVAERLIDSNSNTNNKDAGYLENQQQNIADAIDLLPFLATGIDVNIKFKRVDDFEFTRECAIFDLLDIPLYHGWIVDPQDVETVNAIGCKSYNTLMGELVALETRGAETQSEDNHEEDPVDFVAATTAALGVPSPTLSNSRSFEDSPTAVADHNELRKGDLEEEAELLRALKLSESDKSTTHSNSTLTIANGRSEASYSDLIQFSEEDVLIDSQDTVNKCHGSSGSKDLNQPEISISNDQQASKNTETEQACLKIKSSEEEHSTLAMLKTDGGTNIDNFFFKEPKEGVEVTNSNQLDKAEGETVEIRGALANTIPNPEEKISGKDTVKVSDTISLTVPSDSCNISNHDTTESFTNVDPSEPLYEGEDYISPRATECEETEPKYEGEAILAEKTDKNALDSSAVRNKEELTPEQGRLIRNFLKNSASQLTIYGLFCLQEGLKERELCVFFRNNHFSTMFKYDGELYLLATDQGFLNQPDLVWEKLNEVNGDTLFMTGNFKEFKMDDNNDGTWNEHSAVTSTAEYIASINNSPEADVNSDLQLAMALQQQEFEQQQPRCDAQTPSAGVGTSGLVVGPQAPRSNARPPASSSSSRLGSKSSKEKCTVM